MLFHQQWNFLILVLLPVCENLSVCSEESDVIPSILGISLPPLFRRVSSSCFLRVHRFFVKGGTPTFIVLAKDSTFCKQFLTGKKVKWLRCQTLDQRVSSDDSQDSNVAEKISRRPTSRSHSLSLNTTNRGNVKETQKTEKNSLFCKFEHQSKTFHHWWTSFQCTDHASDNCAFSHWTSYLYY